MFKELLETVNPKESHFAECSLLDPAHQCCGEYAILHYADGILPAIPDVPAALLLYILGLNDPFTFQLADLFCRVPQHFGQDFSAMLAQQGSGLSERLAATGHFCHRPHQPH